MMTGSILNERYEIIEKIGEGGMARIYKAKDLRLKRKVAIKVLKTDLESEQEIVSRFVREAQSAARLAHPNIVNVYDIEEHEGSHYIIMEYIEAESLKEKVYKSGPLSLDTAFGIFKQVAGAVKFAHENGIIHRDLKPQNILLTDDGNVKVTDFGIARAVTSSSLTQTGTMMGSVQYFSPEQAQGKSVDKTTDIYSLGIILFECLTGKLPFDAENMVAIAFKQVQEDPPKPSDFNKKLSKKIDWVILRALKKEPAHRYQEVGEMLEAVRSAFFPGRKDVPVEEIAAVTPVPDKEETLVRQPAVTVPEEAEDYDDEDGDDDEIETVEGGSNWIYVGFLIVFLLIITGVFIKRGMLFSALSKDTVSDFEGMSLKKARKLADQRGLQIQIAEESFHDKIPEGFIISQDPPVGSKLPRGGTVMVVLSRGKPVVTIPDLVGLKRETAAQELTRVGLKWVIRNNVHHDTIEKDYVISHDPGANETVGIGRKVMLVLSKGPERVEVPDIVGKTQEEAKKLVGKLGLSLIVTGREYSKKILEGCVISQKPPKGAMVLKKAKIRVVVSQGEEPLKTPSLLGKTISQARQDYSSMGIKIVTERGSTDENITIISQNPKTGAPLPSDRTIRVKLKSLALVPNLLGRRLVDAQNVIDKHGLSMGKITYKYKPRIIKNVVLDQSPKSGIEVKFGTKVNIIVSSNKPPAGASPSPTIPTGPVSSPRVPDSIPDTP